MKIIVKKRNKINTLFLIINMFFSSILFSKEESVKLTFKLENVELEEMDTGMFERKGYCHNCNDCWIKIYHTKSDGNKWEKVILGKKELNVLGIDYSDLPDEEKYLKEASIILETVSSTIFFINKNVGYAFFMWPKKDSYWKTTDGGKIWYKISPYEPSIFLENKNFYSFNSKDIVIWDRKNSYFSNDGGITWKKCGDFPKNAEYIESRACFFNENIGFIIFKIELKDKQNGAFRYSLGMTEDKGCNWQIIYIFENADLMNDISITEKKEILIDGRIGNVNGFFYSKDFGKNFVFIPIALDGIIGSYCYSFEKCFVLSENDEYLIYYSSDGMKTWKKLSVEEINNQKFCEAGKVLWQKGMLFQKINK